MFGDYGCVCAYLHGCSRFTYLSTHDGDFVMLKPCGIDMDRWTLGCRAAFEIGDVDGCVSCRSSKVLSVCVEV